MALAVAAGARRTASAFDAILAFANTRDLSADYGPEDLNGIDALVRSVEGVDDFGLTVGFGGFPPGERTRRDFTIFGRWEEQVTVNRAIITAGRLPDGPDEVLLNANAARALGVRLGSRFEMVLPDRRSRASRPFCWKSSAWDSTSVRSSRTT